MLILDLKGTLSETIAYGFVGLWTIIDGIVFKFVSMFFKLFWQLAGVQLLDNSVYRAIANRIYLFIGIIALFALTVALLKALVNPDELSKGLVKSFKSLITSVILVILTPSIFNYAFSLQGAMLEDDIIGKIFQIDLNAEKEDGEENITYSDDSMNKVCNIENGEKISITNIYDKDKQPVEFETSLSKKECQGNYIAMSVLEAFFTPVSEDVKADSGTKWKDAKKYIIYTGDFTFINTFAKQATDAEESASINYSFIISTVAGVVLIYLLISFCIDLGVRAAKLAFYQLIAPIPILFKMIPGKEGQYDKWSKSTISTFLEVFVRLIIINFVIFMISNLFAIIDSLDGFDEVGLIGKAILAMGLFMFAKQAPKLLQDAIGIQGGNLKVGVKGKLKDGGALAAAAGIGGAATTAVRNFSHNVQQGKANIANANGGFNKAKALGGAILHGATSTIAGAGSGLIRGTYGARNAGTYTDMRKAASKAATDAVNKRDQREAYRASHGDSTRGVLAGHVSDATRSLGQWAGIDSLAELRTTQSKIQVVADAQKAVGDRLNKMLDTSEKTRVATRDISVANVGGFNRLADMENELEIMKSTGMTSGVNGSARRQVSAADLTNMELGIKDLKKQLKTDIMLGQKKDASGNIVTDIAGMDGELKSLITDYRTKARANIDSVRKTITDSAIIAPLNAALANSGSLEDFISSGDANKLFDNGGKAVTNANNNVRQEINNHLDTGSNNNS